MSKILSELLKATKAVKKADEPDDRFRGRLVRAATDMADDAWGKLSTEAQAWVNAGVESMNEKKPVGGFPDEVAEEAPAPKARAKAPVVDDEDDDLDEPTPAAKPKAKTAPAEDAEPVAKPAKAAPKAPVADEDDDLDDDDEAPVAKPAAKAKPAAEAAPVAKPKAKPVAEEATEAPAPKAKAAPAAEETPVEAPKKKKSAGKAYRKAMLENPSKSMDEVFDIVIEQGYTISKNTAYITWYETRQTVEVLAGLDAETIKTVLANARK